MKHTLKRILNLPFFDSRSSILILLLMAVLVAVLAFGLAHAQEYCGYLTMCPECPCGCGMALHWCGDGNGHKSCSTAAFMGFRKTGPVAYRIIQDGDGPAIEAAHATPSAPICLFE